jgi:hypothetical protein
VRQVGKDSLLPIPRFVGVLGGLVARFVDRRIVERFHGDVRMEVITTFLARVGNGVNTEMECDGEYGRNERMVCDSDGEYGRMVCDSDGEYGRNERMVCDSDGEYGRMVCDSDGEHGRNKRIMSENDGDQVPDMRKKQRV